MSYTNVTRETALPLDPSAHYFDLDISGQSPSGSWTDGNGIVHNSYDTAWYYHDASVEGLFPIISKWYLGPCGALRYVDVDGQQIERSGSFAFPITTRHVAGAVNKDAPMLADDPVIVGDEQFSTGNFLWWQYLSCAFPGRNYLVIRPEGDIMATEGLTSLRIYHPVINDGLPPVDADTAGMFTNSSGYGLLPPARRPDLQAGTFTQISFYNNGIRLTDTTRRFTAPTTGLVEFSFPSRYRLEAVLFLAREDYYDNPSGHDNDDIMIPMQSLSSNSRMIYTGRVLGGVSYILFIDNNGDSHAVREFQPNYPGAVVALSLGLTHPDFGEPLPRPGALSMPTVLASKLNTPSSTIVQSTTSIPVENFIPHGAQGSGS